MNTKNVLSELVERHALQLNSMSAKQYHTLISELDINVYLTHYVSNEVASHTVICRDIEDMYIVLLVTSTNDRSNYFISVYEVTSCLIDAVSAMNKRLIVDLS